MTWNSFTADGAELVRRAARAGAADRLAEERVVVVGAVDDEAVQRAALAGEADVAGAHVGRDARRQQRKVDEVAAVDRQVPHRRFADRGAHLRFGRFENRRRRDHGQRFSHAGDAHFEPQRQRAADGDLDAGPLSRGEPRQLR